MDRYRCGATTSPDWNLDDPGRNINPPLTLFVGIHTVSPTEGVRGMHVGNQNR